LLKELGRLVAMELDNVDARFLGYPHHLGNRGIDEYTYRERGSFGRGGAGGIDTRSRLRRGNLPSRWRENEPDEIRSGGYSCRRVLRFTQAADFHHAAAGKELRQSLLVRG
jgi:hypothetical protein